MKKFFTLLYILSILAFNPINAQIPNNSFEDWANNVPSGWITSNALPAYQNVTQSTNAHSGSYAAKGESVAFGPVIIPPLIQAGIEGAGFAFNQRPKSITGYYQFSPLNGDRLGINVILYKEGAAIAYAPAMISSAAGSYTQFSVDFIYLSNDNPDHCVIQFLIAPVENAQYTSAGSTFLIDDVEFTGEATVGVEKEETKNVTYKLDQNYPNPFNPSTVISYSIPTESFVTLKLYDIMGKEVTTLVNEYKPAGSFSIKLDAASIGNLTSGTYFYRLSAGNFVSTKKLIYIK